ncbi:hypothetical protein SNEBB_005143 [Seison nebaliae]|nr:hypothetical protein SNEBB_005143 [Seison nebaliae]
MGSISTKELNPKQVGKLLTKVDTIFIRVDGLIWNWPDVNVSAINMVNELQNNLRKEVYFFSFNTNKHREFYVKRLQKIGVNTTEHYIITNIWLAIRYYKSIDFKGKLYVVADEIYGIGKELEESGIDYEWDPTSMMNSPPFEEVRLSSDVNGVLVCFDSTMNYQRITKAINYSTRIPSTNFLICDCTSLFQKQNINYPTTYGLSQVIMTSVQLLHPQNQPIVLGLPDNGRIVHNLLPLPPNRLKKSVFLTFEARIGVRLARAMGFGSACVINARKLKRKKRRNIQVYHIDAMSKLYKLIRDYSSDMIYSTG